MEEFEDAEVLVFWASFGNGIWFPSCISSFALIVPLAVDVDEAEVDDAEVLVDGSISLFAIMDPLGVKVDEAEALLWKFFSSSSFQDLLLRAVLSLVMLVIHALWITCLHMPSLVGGDVLGDLDGDDSHGSLTDWAVRCFEGGPCNVQSGHQKLM